MPSPSKIIFDAFIRQEPTTRIASFEDWLGRNCGSLVGLDISQVDGFVEANKRRLWNYVKTEIREISETSELKLIEVYDEDRMLFLNLQYDLSKSPKSTRDRKLGFRWALFELFDGLSWRQYEAAAYVAAELFGAKKVELTQGGNEGGVDLYAVIPNNGATKIFHGRHAHYRVVGQSKKYESAVAVGKVREFVHVLDAVRARSAEIESRVPPWFREYDGPVVGWLNAHSGFQSGSADIARAHGILASDTLKLCDSVLSVRRTPLFAKPDQLRSFFSERILAVLNAASS